MAPKVAFISACYNVQAFIAECVESMLTQTITDFELILIDDGSTDGTCDILNEYAKADRRIRVLRSSHEGPANARNKALQIATAKWLAVLDSDDVALPERLERQLAHAKLDPILSLLGSGCIEIAEDGRPLHHHVYPPDHQQLKNRLLSMSPFFPHSSAFFRREAALAVGGYRPRFTRSQDYDLFLRLQATGRMACVQEPLIKLRRHKGSLTAQDGARLQLVMGVAALADYLHGAQIGRHPEPMADAEWNAMLAWIDQTLDDRGWYQERRFREMARTVRYARCLSERASAFLGLLKNAPDICCVLLRLVYEQYLPHQVAQEAAARLTSGTLWPGESKK